MIPHLKIVMLKGMEKNIHILSTLASTLIGVSYFTYVSRVEFPPDAVRIAPLVWLTSSIAGLIFGFRSLRGDGALYIGILVIIVAIMNILFAGIFSLAALVGDWESARRVELDLPETGVCSSDGGGVCCEPEIAEA